MRHSVKVITLVLAALAVSIQAGDTAGQVIQWRGPTRNGIYTEKGLLKQWPQGGPKLAWKANGLGAGFSSLGIADGKIFTMGDKEGASCVIALDIAGGKPLWTTKIGKGGDPGGYPGTRSTPTFADGMVYALGQFGELACLNAKDGAVVWSKHLPNDFGGVLMSGWGYSESPLVDGEMVVVTPGGGQGTVLALNRKTGATVWQTKEWTDKGAYASLQIAEIGGIRQYLQLTDATVAGVSAKDGRVLWKGARPGKTAVIPDPIYHNNHVFVTSGYGVGCNLFRIQQQGQQFAATQVYANKDMINHHGGCVLIGEYIYGFSDGPAGWSCLDIKTGSPTWKNKGVGKGTVAFADGMLYMRSEGQQGTIALAECTPQGYVEKGRFDQPERSGRQSWAHLVIHGGKLYVRDMDLLLCYDIKQ